MLDRIKINKLLNAYLTSQNGIFGELKSMRKNKSSYLNAIDGKSDEIPALFANKYSNLYNSVDDENELMTIKDEVCKKVITADISETEKITPNLLREASKKLRTNKSDPISTILSDYFINAPDIVYKHLSNVLRSYLTHGHISIVLTVSTMFPVLKDKLDNHSDSNNYRSIAISSVILKLFDWVFIILYQKCFYLDQLQFSYQPNCSTTMCTWQVLETIDYFLRNGSEIFVCMMDMTKAFDNVKHSILFRKLLNRGLPPIVLRFLIYIYEVQVANVKWNGQWSNTFHIKNGVKQGAVLSAILYCVYVDDLFDRLKRNKHGCWINGYYYGIAGYADDNALLSPSLDGLQEMINTCDKYAKEHNLTFSTNENVNKSKTKCMVFLKKKRSLKNLKLRGYNLPWVSFVKHLGCKIENTLGGMKQDLREKRAQFIQRNNEICQEFSFAHPVTKTQLNAIYNCHLTGSPLWDLFSRESEMLESTWNIAIRKMFKLDRTTHRYFIEPISEMKHVKWSLIKRFVNFIQKIQLSSKSQLKNLLMVSKKDCRSTTGRNIKHITKLFDGKPIETIKIEDLKKLK